MHIRLEQEGDAQAIHRLLVQSFPTDAEARLVDELREANLLSLSLVAERDGQIVGHVAWSPVEVAGCDGGVGLAPLAVHPDYQRRGIAAALVRTGLDLARQQAWRFVVVLGEPAYYSRFGFRPASNWSLHDAYGGGEAFQALELVPGSIPRGAGLVRYAAPFSMFDS